LLKPLDVLDVLKQEATPSTRCGSSHINDIKYNKFILGVIL